MSGPLETRKSKMETIRGKILDADMMGFVTPLYFYGTSAQLKALVRYLNLDYTQVAGPEQV